MKYIFFLLVFNIAFSQEAKFNVINKQGSFSSYLSSDNRQIKIGDTLQIKYPSNGNEFVYITQGNMRASTILVNRKIVVSNIKSINEKIYILFKGFGLLPLYIDFEAALETKEIK
jgi:hypothetical protein